jgi:predicted AlkP superfamily pyrophosphatase or phosphodiesterase
MPTLRRICIPLLRVRHRSVTLLPVRKTVVLNCVGLSPRLISPARTPRIDAFVRAGKLKTIAPALPAVTCSVQTTYLTGAWPNEHGIVGNGWYDHAECEIKFWKQSDRLVQRPRVWDFARQRDERFTCANICWWYALYCGAEYTVTPRPMYPADGRKIPDCWTNPPGLRDELQHELGQFPLFRFWGPATTIESTRWIADAAMYVDRKYEPALSLVYLPHLDYALQKHGPGRQDSDLVGAAPAAWTREGEAVEDVSGADPIAPDLLELDQVVGDLLDHFQGRDARVILLSEYGIAPVRRAVHPNRVLREAGLIQVREELGRELLDAGASSAFAVADHPVAHVYFKDPQRVEEVAALLTTTAGVGTVLQGEERRAAHLDHERAGDLILLAEPDSWFTYYYWLDDARAPDFARTVDIHRKPGYDPIELYLDPAIRFPKAKIGWALLKRKLGMRAMMEVIPLEAGLLRGSHGLAPRDPMDGAMLCSSEPSLLNEVDDTIEPTEVMELMLRHLELG